MPNIRWFPSVATAAFIVTAGHVPAARAQEASEPKPVIQMTISRDTVKLPPGYLWDSVRVEQNWHKLKRGLSKEEVVKLLGHPNGCGISVGGELVIWIYGQRDVVFNSVMRKVSDWDAWTPKRRTRNAWP